MNERTKFWALITGLIMFPIWAISFIIDDFKNNDAEQTTAYEQCALEMEQTGVDLDCNDDDADWYKKKQYKSKTDSVFFASSSKKSGFGSSSSSSGGG